MSTPSRARGAFTIVELLIFAAIAAVPCAVTWNMLLTGSRQSHHLGSRLSALQAAQLAVETLRDDFGQLCYFPERGPGLTGENQAEDPKHQVELLRFKNYEFRAGQTALYGAGASEKQLLGCDRVAYRFDTDSHRLLRNGKPLGGGRFLDVQFRLESTPVEGGIAKATNRLGVVLVLGPEEKLDRRPESITDAEKITLAFSIGLPRKTAAEAYPGWNPNAWDARPAVD